MSAEKLTDWLASIIQGLVNYPDDVKVVKTSDDMGVLYTVTVNPKDNGMVIGKEGSIANAMRVLLRSAGRLNDVRASMKVDVPNSKYNPRD
jgi:hypothetical protein